MIEENSISPILDDKAIGRNLYLYRKMADLKVIEVAERLGLKESAYSKYERGETGFTLDFIKRAAEVLHVNPLLLLTVTPNNIIESGNNSPGAILGMVYGNYTYQTVNDQQNQMMLKLMENITTLSDKVVELLNKQPN
jgi:transcriptional regulator with XRE-family HTH domain